ncbi:MAG: pyrrolo-quinoline quinone [Gammaproteobacteria bacterium]|nr:pyrrolo-quinoline quinone [Gammaproteobacteria bacterium]
MKKIVIILGVWLFNSGVMAAATDIANVPIEVQNASKPNIIFGLDDSSSMDSEVLLNTNDGALWWNSSQKSFVESDGDPLFNAAGTASGSWYKYVYLFPNGVSSDGRINSDASNDHFAIPPTADYAFMRSADYNPLYYNPQIDYTPWASAYISGALRTYSNVTATAARSHPAIPLTSTGTTLNLFTNFNANNSNWQNNNWTFRMMPGMEIPAGNSSNPVRGCKVGSSSCKTFTSKYTIPNNETWNVAISYYPATYYVKERCNYDGVNCVYAPKSSTTLKRYEIKSGNSFPGGRTYSAEMQNFANWFTYYRKRKLMLSAAMGQVLSQISNLRGGITTFNNLTAITMYDFSSASDSQNWRALLGSVYTNATTGGTPTRNALNYIGQQYKNNSAIIQNACQVNAAMILTDGYANTGGPNAPSYNRDTYGKGAPYTLIYDNSLADLGLAYYTENLRRDLPAGLVPVDINNTLPSADKNPNLHMNTYALTLGTKGTIFGVNNSATQNPYAYPPSWPPLNQDRNPSAVDDLWHATINGRGLMLNTSDPPSVVTAIQQLINAVLIKASAGAAIGINPVNLNPGSNIAYASSYNSNYGELIPFLVDLNTGIASIDPQGWSARDLLTARTSANRIIATYNGTKGIPFQWSSLPSSLQSSLNSAMSPPGPNDGQNLLNWLRGDKTLEGTKYRVRSYLLGDIVYAEPVVVRNALANYADSGYGAFKQSIANRSPMIYQGANDGMLHAFNANTGQEAWAYVPRLNFDQLNKLASLSYNHRFYVDGTPVVSDVNSDNGWMTLLVGGLRAGGNGYYGLDITNPEVSNETNLATKVKWEFPNATTAAATQNNIGLSFGKPIIAKTKAAGWVVLVTSGYNNIAGDGRGHLFVLNINNGNVIKDLVTTSGTSANPSGLAQISAFAQNKEFDATIDYVYGGDLNGNLWRFDLSGATISDWNIKLLAQLVNAQGQAQPITSAPELGLINNRRMVYVGTGQMLGNSDIANTQTQSMYALVDNAGTNPTISPLRSNLVQRAVINDTITGSAVDYVTKQGWVIDFPQAGERTTSDPTLAFGSLVFTTNLPSSVACSAKSFLYAVDIINGTQLVANSPNQTVPPARQLIGNFLTTRPVVVVLPSGKVVALTHNADSTVLTLDLPSNTTNVARKLAWKELLRQ